MPPVQPMLAKSVSGIPDPAKSRGPELRAQVGRLPLHRVPRRRRGRADQPQHQAADPLLPRARRGDQGAAAGAHRARRRGLRRARRPEVATASSSRSLQERIHPAKSRVDMLAEKTPAGFVAFDLLALGDESYVDRPLAERRAALEEALGRPRRRPLLPDPHHHRPGRGGPLVRGVRGRRARRGHRQAARRAVHPERPHHDEDQARAHRRRGGRRLPRAQDVHPRGAAARQPAARPVRRRRAPARRRQRVLHRRSGAPS